MRFRLAERWPTATDTYVVADDAGRPAYTVHARLLGLRDKLTICDPDGSDVATLIGGWLGRGYRVTLGERPVAEVRMGRRPRVELLDGRGRVTVKGRVAGREYRLRVGRQTLATVSRKLLSLTDAYGLEVPDPADALVAVAIAVALHRLSSGHR